MVSKPAAASENLLEMHILGPTPDPLNQTRCGVGPSSPAGEIDSFNTVPTEQLNACQVYGGVIGEMNLMPVESQVGLWMKFKLRCNR